MNTTIFIILIFYAIFLLATGFFLNFFRKAEHTDLIANRSLNYWVTAIAAHASDMSAWLFMGFPAAIYMIGTPGAWIAIGLIGGMFLTWKYVAEKLRIDTEKADAPTIPAFLAHHYKDEKGVLRLISSTIMIFFFTCYIAAGLTGMGRVFESVFEIPYATGILVGLAVAVIYLLIGGFAARAWNDFFQGIFLLIAIMIVPLCAFYSLADGWQSIEQAAQLKHISLSLFPNFSTESALEFINGIMWGVGYFGMPHIIINFMALDDVRSMKKAQYIGMTWQFLALASAVFLGIVSIAYFRDPLVNPELLFVFMVQKLFNPIAAGLILCAMLAATMTTIDTQIMVTASTLSHDFIPLLFSFSNNKNKPLLLNISLIIVALISYLIAIQNSSTVMGLVTYAWSGLASAFSPLILMSLYKKNISLFGACAGILSGALISALWPLFNTTLLPLIPGFGVNFMILYLNYLHNKSLKI